MNGALWIFISRSAAMTLLTLSYAALLPRLSRRYTARYLSAAWAVIALGWFFPFCTGVSIPLVPVYVSHAPLPAVLGDVRSGASPLPLLALGGIWLTGVFICSAYHALRLRCLTKLIRRRSEPTDEAGVLEALDRAKEELGIKDRIEIFNCSCLTSPALIGMLRPRILLPSEPLSEEEFHFVLKHELIHLKRRDVWCKALLTAVKILYWFNPASYLMAREAEIWREISCDEAVLQGVDMSSRQRYGELIIMTARRSAAPDAAVAVSFYGGVRHMKTRLLAATSTSPKKLGGAILSILLFSIALTGLTAALPSEAGASAAESRRPSVGITAGNTDSGNFDPEVVRLIELLSGRTAPDSEGCGAEGRNQPPPSTEASAENGLNGDDIPGLHLARLLAPLA